MIRTLLVLVLSYSAAYADCYSGLSNSYKDSHTHQVAPFNHSDNLKEVGTKALNYLFRTHHCVTEMVELECHELVRGKSNTEICYGEGTYGYFLISKDYMDTVNVTFNRWD